VVISEEVDVSHCKTIAEAKQYLFGLDAKFFRRALTKLNDPNFAFQTNDGSGKRYYVMSKLFQGVVLNILVNN
jgi:hypothetical protein